MPIIKSAIKRVKQATVRRDRNVATKRAIKDATKAFEAKPSAASLSAAHSELDKALKKNLFHKNTVARRKAGLAKTAKEAGVKLSAAPKKTATKTTAPKAATTKTTAKKPAAAPKTAAKKPAVAKKPAAKKPAAKTTKK